MGLGGAGQAEARAPAGTALPAAVKKDLLPTFRLCSHVLGALTRRKPMGSPTLAALLLSLRLLLIGLSASAGIGCPCLPCWNTRCLLASHMVRCRLLLGGDTCLAQAGKAPTLLSVLSYLPKSLCSGGSLTVSSYTVSKEQPRSWWAQCLVSWIWGGKSHSGWAISIRALELGGCRGRDPRESALYGNSH